MLHSYAETLTLTCAACGRDFEAKFWLIVDMAEQPDLQVQGHIGLLAAFHDGIIMADVADRVQTRHEVCHAGQ